MNQKPEDAGMKVSAKLDPISSRLACDVLEELRTCHKTRNYAVVRGLVEELQAMFNRMEAALENYSSDYGSIRSLREDMREARKKEKASKASIERDKRLRDDVITQVESATADLKEIHTLTVMKMAELGNLGVPAAGKLFNLMRKEGFVFYKQPEG